MERGFSLTSAVASGAAMQGIKPMVAVMNVSLKKRPMAATQPMLKGYLLWRQTWAFVYSACVSSQHGLVVQACELPHYALKKLGLSHPGCRQWHIVTLYRMLGRGMNAVPLSVPW